MIRLIPELRSRFDRAAGSGFRCIKRIGAEPLPEVKWVADFQQSIDYLETREDIDASKTGYQGISSARSGVPCSSPWSLASRPASCSSAGFP